LKEKSKSKNKTQLRSLKYKTIRYEEVSSRGNNVVRFSNSEASMIQSEGMMMVPRAMQV
jgi:hypothetical protein